MGISPVLQLPPDHGKESVRMTIILAVCTCLAGDLSSWTDVFSVNIVCDRGPNSYTKMLSTNELFDWSNRHGRPNILFVIPWIAYMMDVTLGFISELTPKNVGCFFVKLGGKVLNIWYYCNSASASFLSKIDYLLETAYFTCKRNRESVCINKKI